MDNQKYNEELMSKEALRKAQQEVSSEISEQIKRNKSLLKDQEDLLKKMKGGKK